MTARVLVLAGPTAAGKTAAAIAVAERFDAVIVSADAMQVYRGMDVGSGKATLEERGAVPHFGLDVVDPDEAFDAADFVRLADEVCAGSPRVVVAGGTTLYLRAFLRGLVATPPVDRVLRAELQALPDPHEALQREDPALAERIHPNDRVRILRGLEVARTGAVRLSELQAAHATQPDRVVAPGLWLDADDLDARIEARLEAMFARGYVEEVRGLLARYSRDLKPLRSLGYRHLAEHVLDGLSLEEAARRTARDTRQFARKQRNWMRQLAFEQIDGSALDRVLSVAERALVG